ncbi:MAG: hypothetical protein H8E34_02140 [Bacteroidetes bacterium]|nr:hypothetical protein [Bacteroidota bacterium]
MWGKVIVSVFLLLYSCNSNTEKEPIEKWKQEILETEQNFARQAHKEGVPKAFLTYTAEDAVLLRNNQLVIGKNAIREYYKNKSAGESNVSLTWKPDFMMLPNRVIWDIVRPIYLFGN